MNLKLDNLDWEIAAQIAGYAWALQQPLADEYDEYAAYSAHFRQFVKGTDWENDPPNEAGRAMSLEAFERGAAQSRNLIRSDIYLSLADCAEIARCDISYIKAECLRYERSGGKSGLYSQKVGKGRTGHRIVHPDDFRKWLRNPRRGSRSK